MANSHVHKNWAKHIQPEVLSLVTLETKFTGIDNIIVSDCSSNCLKLVSAIFYRIFIFSPNDSPLKTMKNVFYFI